MDTTSPFIALIDLHLELSELMRKSALDLDMHLGTKRTLIDCLVMSLNDLETAIAANDGSYPDFCERAYRSAQARQYETSRAWFHEQYLAETETA